MKRIILNITSYIVLIAITLGFAIYGMASQPRYDIKFKGIAYKEESFKVLKNKSGHHIYLEYSEDYSETTITIENDDVIITIYNNQTKFSIEKNGITVNGNFEEVLETEENHTFKDYYTFVRSYYEHINMKDAFPVEILFPIFALPPLLFGILILIDILKRREKVSLLRIIYRTILCLLFISFYSLEIFLIIRNL